ncbi:MAG: HD domain-containing protein [Pseudomonadota bacterium]
MKKQYAGSVRAGELVNDIFVLSEKNISQKKDGSDYINVLLSDKTGKLKGVAWDNVDKISADKNPGDFVHVKGSISEYKGALQIVIKDMENISSDSIDPSDFLPSTKQNIDLMFERLLKLSGSIEEKNLKALLDAFWADNKFVENFKIAPAAKKMHHAYSGGLLEHTLSMALLADKIAGHYIGIDRDLLIVGTILHDIGKVREFVYKYSIDYSDEGRLLSHIVIGIGMLDEKIKTIKEFPETLAVLLRHMIVSHHGTREFGSPEPPKTIDAVLLNYIDEIDSKISGIRDYISSDDAGGNWTSYHRLLGRHFYTANNNMQNKEDEISE